MADQKTCVLCGHRIALDRFGSAGVGDASGMLPLCHADDHDCYHCWTVYRERPESLEALLPKYSAEPALFVNDDPTSPMYGTRILYHPPAEEAPDA